MRHSLTVGLMSVYLPVSDININNLWPKICGHTIIADDMSNLFVFQFVGCDW